jgi:hypothetical protein
MKKARKRKKQQGCKIADLNIRTLQKIEAGELNVLITTAARIQRGPGCSWEKLMPGQK